MLSENDLLKQEAKQRREDCIEVLKKEGKKLSAAEIAQRTGHNSIKIAKALSLLSKEGLVVVYGDTYHNKYALA